MAKDTRKIKQTKFVNEDVENVKKLGILLVIVIILCIGVYFLTEKLLSKKTDIDKNTTTEVDFNYDLATIGTMFNRPEDKYYVLLYSNEEDSGTYDTILNKYRSSDDYIKTYYIDLDLKINNSALTETLNKKPTKSSEVSVKGATLYKIEKGKVTNCYSTLEDIKDILS